MHFQVFFNISSHYCLSVSLSLCTYFLSTLIQNKYVHARKRAFTEYLNVLDYILCFSRALLAEKTNFDILTKRLKNVLLQEAFAQQ